MNVLKRGDLVWLDFDPQAGHEQAGRRPAIILSEADFNDVTGSAVACPITIKAKDYPFEVALPDDLPISGVVLTDQFKSLDVKRRRIKVVGNAGVDTEFMKMVMRNVRSILA